MMSNINIIFFAILFLFSAVCCDQKMLSEIKQSAWGGYSTSCNSCSLNQYNLTCNCQNSSGSWVSSTINLNNYFSNQSGVLQRGSTDFFQQCGSCSLQVQQRNNMGYIFLNCYCKQGGRGVDFAETQSVVNIDQWISNQNGQLTIVPN